MKKIKIFLVSSNELKSERDQFEIEIYRKTMGWFDRGIFLHLDIWEDIGARRSGSQSEYDKFVKDADLFIFLAYSNAGMYTAEEFENSIGQFVSTKKPFIYTYFKIPPPENADPGLEEFKKKLTELKHFYATFNNFNDLWNQFNKELDRLEEDGFTENKRPEQDGGIKTINQTADKIYNIDKIESANFNGGGHGDHKEAPGISPIPNPLTDEVSCTLYAPGEVLPGSQFLVQVFAHTDKQLEFIEGLAHLADETSTLRGTALLPEILEWNAKIDFNLILPGLTVDEPTLSINWKGKIVFVQFGVIVPNDLQTSDIIGTVIIAKNSVPIGKIKFKIKIISAKSNQYSSETKNYPNKMARFQQAFISYASQDRQEVLKRVQMLNLMEVNFFQDLLTLEPGQVWEKQIYNYIDACDVFFLFWSKAASTAEWVMKEVRYAKEKKGINWDSPPEIIPVIIEGPPPAEPPPELNFIHFNDKFIYFINPKS